jgi:hypothetical protein
MKRFTLLFPTVLLAFGLSQPASADLILGESLYYTVSEVTIEVLAASAAIIASSPCSGLT